MPRVFISYAAQDLEFVEEHILEPLAENEIDTWIDRSNIRSASQWERSIVRGLESCDWFLLVMSPNSVNSEWVKDELTWAIDARPWRILPVQIGECAPEDFHIRLKRIQSIDFRYDRKAATEKLISAFDEGVGTSSVTTKDVPTQPEGSRFLRYSQKVFAVLVATGLMAFGTVLFSCLLGFPFCWLSSFLEAKGKTGAVVFGILGAFVGMVVGAAIKDAFKIPKRKENPAFAYGAIAFGASAAYSGWSGTESDFWGFAYFAGSTLGVLFAIETGRKLWPKKQAA